ncbi:Uncharacterised protein [Vibrio cholerae]|nr:Uncharacterised protein [Vibrio cholerae]
MVSTQKRCSISIRKVPNCKRRSLIAFAAIVTQSISTSAS